jgi:hypothetical protein
MDGPAYTRAEVLASDGGFQNRGPLCERCRTRIPQFAELTTRDRERVLELIRDKQFNLAMRELGAATGCNERWAKIWVLHSGRPHPRFDGPPCPHCGKSLASSQAKQCLYCHADWHGAANPISPLVEPTPGDHLRGAFPSTIGVTLDPVFFAIPVAEHASSPDDIAPLVLNGETLRIPYRLYATEPPAHLVSAFSERQRLALCCLFTRHHSGFERERMLREILQGDPPPWVYPFAIRLLGEYVIEILEVLWTRRDLLRSERCVTFLNDNPRFVALTKKRIVSYWHGYFRSLSPRLVDHVGFRIADELGLWSPKERHRFIDR